MAWGQYGNQSPVQAFKAVPAMQGNYKANIHGDQKVLELFK